MDRPRKTEKREQELTAAVENHRGRVISVIRQGVQDQGEAEDIFQDVFLEFMQAYDLGQAIETLGAWLVRVAQNKIVDRLRRRKTREVHQAEELAAADAEPAVENGPDEEWTRSWLRAELLAGLEMLPKEQREVFVQHELEGKSFEQISHEMGVGVNTLLSRKRYAVIFLRTYLKEVYDELE